MGGGYHWTDGKDLAGKGIIGPDFLDGFMVPTSLRLIRSLD